MHAIARAGALGAAAMMSVQPCLAADQLRDAGGAERQSAAFAGVRLQVPIGAANRERPSARLQLTTFHDYRDASGTTVRSHRAPGIELGLDRLGRPSYHVGGRPVRETEQRLGIGGSTTWIVIGGVVLAVVVLAAVASATPTPGPHPGAFD